MALELTSLAQVQSYLGDSSVTSGTMNTYMNTAEAMIARYCDRHDPGGAHWLSAARVEYADGEMWPQVLCKWTPVSAFTSVAIVTGADTSTSQTLTNLELDGIAIEDLSTSNRAYTGRLGYRYGATGAWSMDAFREGEPYPGRSWLLAPPVPNFGGGHSRVKLTYTGGYAAAPADLALAATILASTLYRRKNVNPTVQSETLGRYSYTARSDMGSTIISTMPEVEEILNNYRRVL